MTTSMGEDDKVPPLENVPPSPTGSPTVKANVELPITNPPSNDGIEWHDLGVFYMDKLASRFHDSERAGSPTVRANIELPITNLPLNDGIEWHNLGVFCMDELASRFHERVPLFPKQTTQPLAQSDE